MDKKELEKDDYEIECFGLAFQQLFKPTTKELAKKINRELLEEIKKS